jgi:hypothetical protein
MTVLDIRINEATKPVDVVWSSPDTDLWVATIDGDFGGMIEFVDGHFVVTDQTGSIVTSASSIPSAQAALEEHGFLARVA